MGLSELGKKISQFAPLLGAALPIPGGAVFGHAIAALFGGDLSKPDDLIKRIEADKDAQLKLYQLQIENQLEIEKLIFSDKKDAREREIRFIEKTGKQDYTLKNLAYITTFGFFVALMTLFLPNLEVDEQEKNLIMVLLGMLASKWQTIIDYYFGTSKSNEGNKYDD